MAEMNHRDWSLENVLLVVIILAFLIYCAIFLYQSLFSTKGITYSVSFDDAMISMTYARNFG